MCGYEGFLLLLCCAETKCTFSSDKDARAARFKAIIKTWTNIEIDFDYLKDKTYGWEMGGVLTLTEKYSQFTANIAKKKSSNIFNLSSQHRANTNNNFLYCIFLYLAACFLLLPQSVHKIYVYNSITTFLFVKENYWKCCVCDRLRISWKKNRLNDVGPCCIFILAAILKNAPYWIKLSIKLKTAFFENESSNSSLNYDYESKKNF